MKSAVLIQARSSSVRLPGKIFARLPAPSGKELILHVFDRAREALTDAVLAVPENDEALSAFCKEKNLPFLVGPEMDVRQRYRMAARKLDCQWVVRATGDNPCIDVAIVKESMDRAQELDADLFSFRNLPLGCAVEIFKTKALNDDSFPASPDDLEHVSLHIKRHPEHFRVVHEDHSIMLPFGDSKPRLTVDTQEDLDVVRGVFASLGDSFGITEVMRLFQKSPEIFQANSHIRQIVPVK